MMQMTLNSEKSPVRPFEPLAGPTPTAGDGANGSASIQKTMPTTNATPAQAIRVILADSQAIYRVGMRKVFALEDDIRVVAQVETLANLYAALQRYPTDVVVLEGQLIAGTTDAIPELVKRAPEAKLIVQLVESDESNIVELYRRGVRGVVPRSISPDLLIKCVRKIAEGETWIDNQSISWVIEAYRSQASNLTSPRTQPKLSKKELAIISCITRGMRNKEIAYQIGTTEQVIKNYLRKVYDKLGVSDRLELALYCLHHQILKNYLQESPDAAAPLAAATGGPLRTKM
jgi:DNA-binding NarL/FixJ family response regulator